MFKSGAWLQNNGPLVYWLGYLVFAQEDGDRYPGGLPNEHDAPVV